MEIETRYMEVKAEMNLVLPASLAASLWQEQRKTNEESRGKAKEKAVQLTLVLTAPHTAKTPL